MREERTWYPGNGTPAPAMGAAAARVPATAPGVAANLRRTANGKPDLQGFYEPDAVGANYGLERRAPDPDGLTPSGRGVIIDPPDEKLPMQPLGGAGKS
jgi:hypothetical protein